MREYGIDSVGARLLKKMNYKEFFNCKYPIVAATMNQVSDLKLAIACHSAGILPSLSVYNYSLANSSVNLEALENDIKQFQDTTGTTDVLISIAKGHFLTPKFLELALKLNIKFIEALLDDPPYMDVDVNLFWEYKRNNIKIIPKVFGSLGIIKNVDAVILKGSNGAGRGLPYIDTDSQLDTIIQTYPSMPVIMSGGIGTSQDINKYLSKGCMAVAIGTLFAASEESSISNETKLKMVRASSKDIKQLSTGAQQNALIFKEGTAGTDDYNNTLSLVRGIKNPTTGHVFAGTSIDNITAIRPVKDIVQELIQDLDNFTV
jgi:NAD(P)H-dependent flavin oxidoreductase YrpB (nitropropane dioxygenase family)